MLGRTVARQTAIIARSNPQSFVKARGVHIENTVYNNMPFDYRNKKTFALKVAAFFITGFSIPFIAAKYQLVKSGAGAGAA
ncbi:hypothetical protein M408DRAFT_326162 [Serendipita vermifera MAFF 305830]|uniref:Cytochrome c oxidase subunit 8, mitochondrial n=1 Tax=Serendipita vermifera MAFF 305830 TaxID=933852 RepID=A0A0C2X5P3_SERVB|nr:hypothetical protein M408DRAFT_326162 [Serendipita vermifera MAFF 305830]